jgi:hypothetical protein
VEVVIPVMQGASIRPPEVVTPLDQVMVCLRLPLEQAVTLVF